MHSSAVPPSSDAALAEARALLAAGKPAEAVVRLEAARGALPDDPALLAELGIVRKLAGDPGRALGELQAALDAVGDRDLALAQRTGVVLALTLDDLGRRSDAIAAFERVERLDPQTDEGKLARYYAQAYRASGD